MSKFRLGWFTKGRVMVVLLALSVFMNVLLAVMGSAYKSHTDQLIRSLHSTNDNLKKRNALTIRRIKKDSVIIHGLLVETNETASRISDVLAHPVNTDSLKIEVWRYLNSEK